ncbi:hypothetical protein FB451DRAFT_189861 [Mycena latifolia]|nr:hypothetical protein FB451DRAFT_189861 [Mycena latifolia]
MPGPALAYGPGDYSEADAQQYVALTYVQNYVLYATACLLVYELLTSLDVEVARIWSLRWRLPKILFMLNRYVIRGMLVVLWILADYPGTSAEFCRIYAYWQMIPLRLAILAAQALVVIRVWAIYNNSRMMFWVLSGLYTAEVVAVASSVIMATMDTQGVAQPAPLSCALNSISGYLLKRYASATWIAPVCFEFVMVLITLAKLIPRWSWRHKARGKGVIGSGGNATLDVLARDSLIYFGFIFTFTLTNAVIYELSFSAHYHSILLGPTSAISCIAVSRMMINMRSLPSATNGQPTSASAAVLSFADEYEEVPRTATTAFGSFDTRGPKDYAPFDLRTPTDADASFDRTKFGCAYKYGPPPHRPSSARTSGDATRVGEHHFEPYAPFDRAKFIASAGDAGAGYRPSSARTSGDATRVGEGDEDEGSVIEMGVMGTRH